MLPQLRPLKSKLKPMITKLGKGINNGVPDFDVELNNTTDEQNLDSREYPVLNVRPSRTAYATQITGTPYGLGNRQNTSLMIVDGTDWKYWDGSAWQTITALTGTANADIIDFGDYTVLVNGTDNKYWDGTTAGDVATMPDMTYLAVHANRMFGVKSTNSIIYVSALSLYNDWTTANDSAEIDNPTQGGENSSGLVEYKNHIIQFKPHSMHELYGEDIFNFELITVSNSIGCVSHRSIVEINGLLYFLGENGVYVYSGGTEPVLISDPWIKSYIDRMDKSNMGKACAGTDGDRYYLCLPIDTDDRVVLTYDTDRDRRSWHVEDTTDFVDFIRFDNVLYGLKSDGTILEMVDTDGEEEISWYAISKKIMLENPSGKKYVRNLIVVLTLPTGSTCQAYLKTPDDDWTSVKTFSVDADIQNGKIGIPLTVGQNVDWFQIKFAGTGTCTIHRLEIQLREKGSGYLG